MNLNVIIDVLTGCTLIILYAYYVCIIRSAFHIKLSVTLARLFILNSLGYYSTLSPLVLFITITVVTGSDRLRSYDIPN